jgi:hypothetical protein
VRYRLLRQTDHVHHDWDLAGPKTWAQPEKVVEFNGVRAFPRVEIDLPIVLVEMPASRKPLVVHGHAVNLSEGGLSVVIEPRLMHPKKNLLIRFPGSGARQDITVNARLRHRNGMRHGFEFVRLSEQSRNAVRELCQRAGA